MIGNPGARCSRCNTMWFPGKGRTAYYKAVDDNGQPWVGPCCEPLTKQGQLRDLEAELTGSSDE